MNEREYREYVELLKDIKKEIKALEYQISVLKYQISWLIKIFENYRFFLYPPLNKEKFKIRREHWGRCVLKESISIKKEIEYIKETFKKNEISLQDAILFYNIKLADMTSYLASKSLLGHCGNCDGQLQLLVENNTIYLTCTKCGRWLWQGLKHEKK